MCAETERERERETLPKHHRPEVKEEGLKKHLCTDKAAAVDREETRHFQIMFR